MTKQNIKKRICNGVYLDHAATSPVKKEVLDAILPYLTEKFGNPSSLHSWGQEAKYAIEMARENAAKFLNCEPREVIFTSGGTESDNMAIRGVIMAISKKTKIKPHIITTQFEHHAVLRTCEYLEKNNLAEITYLKPNTEGLIELEKVKEAIKDNTVLITIMYVNNEVGTVQPIREIGKMVEKENRERLAVSGQRVYFHTDAVQATEYQEMNVDYLHVDLLTLSGHKIGAPKGIGLLYLKAKTPFEKITFGGEQELEKRAGTENVAGIVALGKALEIIKDEDPSHVMKLRDHFIDRVKKEIPKVHLNGSRDLRSPNNANFYFEGIEGESILLNLDLVGIGASSGSACTSLALQPSHVLMSLYDQPERAHGSIRFTFGAENTMEEIDYAVIHLKEIVQKLRAMSPLWRE